MSMDHANRFLDVPGDPQAPPEPCRCDRTAMPMGKLIQSNGVVQVCARCEIHAVRHFIRKSAIRLLGVTLADLPVWQDNRRCVCLGAGCLRCVAPEFACERCGSRRQVQLHHWAPHHLFDDSDLWPQSPLCADCHARWHKVVTPNMGKRAAS